MSATAFSSSASLSMTPRISPRMRIPCGRLGYLTSSWLPTQWRSRPTSMSSVSVGSPAKVASDDLLFEDYKPNYAFLFPGQGAQTVGMGVAAQSVPAAADLFQKANDILGFDLLDVCTNGPKEKLDSTVISQAHVLQIHALDQSTQRKKHKRC